MPIQWVFLDLDNTLWDFDRNAEAALFELFHRHNLEHHSGYKSHQFIELYKDVNAAFWRKYESGEISKETLRTQRFVDTFSAMGIPLALQPKNVWEEYLQICPLMTKLMPGAIECLEILFQKFKIALLTNGFEETQHLKIEGSGIKPFIEFMQTSESVGFAKPASEFFELALKKANITADNVVYIGDNFKTDVIGGSNAGIKTFWYKSENNMDEIESLGVNQLNYCGEITDLVEWATFVSHKM